MKLSDFFYQQWFLFFWIGTGLAVIFGVVSYMLHRYDHRHFTDRRNWGTILAVGVVSSIYALLSGVDTLADVKGELGESTRTTVALYLICIKTVAIAAAGLAGLTILALRDRIELLQEPSLPENYYYLFGGFDGKQFLGFGAPFQLEGEWYQTGPDGECSALAREQLKRLTRIEEALYIFHSKADFERAKAFFEKGVFPHAESVIPNEWIRARLNRKGKIVLYEPQTETALDMLVHSYSFFLGTRRGQPCCILYPAHRITVDTRQPQLAVLINNDPAFFQLLKSYFIERQKQIEGGNLKNRFKKHLWCPESKRFVT